MNIEEYLKNALAQIDRGVAASATDTSAHDFVLLKNGSIKFDLAVVNRADQKGKLRLEVLAIGARGSKRVSHEQVSRVSFEISYRIKNNRQK